MGKNVLRAFLKAYEPFNKLFKIYKQNLTLTLNNYICEKISRTYFENMYKKCISHIRGFRNIIL